MAKLAPFPETISPCCIKVPVPLILGKPAWLDAGYAGMEDVVRAKHMTPIICEKGTRGHPLTDEQKERNRQKSKVRSRVEHVFGFME